MPQNNDFQSSLRENPEINGEIVRSKELLDNNRLFLKNKNIGISISDNEDLALNGLGVQHLQDILIELSRFILSVGGNLVYGGDLRANGFANLLFDLVQVYKTKNVPSDKRLYNYLSWPLNLHLTKEIKAEYKNKINFIEVLPPTNLKIKELNVFIPPDTFENKVIWAECLTNMRNEMEQNCRARVFVGGRVSGFKGKMSGLLEEFLIANRINTPIYLIGGFGGITKKLCCLLTGDSKIELVDNNNVNYEYFEFISKYNESKPIEEQIRYDKIKNEILEFGLDKLIKNSGLNYEEYNVLMNTQNITIIVFLVLKGLSNLKE